MCRYIPLLFFALLLTACGAQHRPSALSDNDELERFPSQTYGIPPLLQATDTSPAWQQQGPRLLVKGTVFQPDGQTPAPGVVLYYYHTDTGGHYTHLPQQPRSMPPNRIGQTHGYIRGWVKTDSGGKYAIYTVKPGIYPERDAPAHIHVTLTEPDNGRSYYIDDLVFDDDTLLTGVFRRKLENRGGSGVARTWRKGTLEVAERNIVLGLNIPGYPARPAGLRSGPAIGEDQPSFMPWHAWGPDAGTRACPVCKYGRYHGLILFAGKDPDWTAIRRWLQFFEQEAVARGNRVKAFFVYGNAVGYNRGERDAELQALGKALNLRYTALTHVPSFSDEASEVNLCRIHPQARTTLIVYRNRTVIDRYADVPPGEEIFSRIRKKLDDTRGEYFDDAVNTGH